MSDEVIVSLKDSILNKFLDSKDNCINIDIDNNTNLLIVKDHSKYVENPKGKINNIAKDIQYDKLKSEIVLFWDCQEYSNNKVYHKGKFNVSFNDTLLVDLPLRIVVIIEPSGNTDEYNEIINEVNKHNYLFNKDSGVFNTGYNKYNFYGYDNSGEEYRTFDSEGLATFQDVGADDRYDYDEDVVCYCGKNKCYYHDYFYDKYDDFDVCCDCCVDDIAEHDDLKNDNVNSLAVKCGISEETSESPNGIDEIILNENAGVYNFECGVEGLATREHSKKSLKNIVADVANELSEKMTVHFNWYHRMSEEELYLFDMFYKIHDAIKDWCNKTNDNRIRFEEYDKARRCLNVLSNILVFLNERRKHGKAQMCKNSKK
ncbi:MAG: hypothetical protein ABIM30_00260 [candidate division WOR-3 bacterium]